MQEEQLIEIIENQLRDGQPIKVKETLMRLMMTRHTPREDAIAAMACALAVEVFDVMKNGASLTKALCRAFRMLPDLSTWKANKK